MPLDSADTGTDWERLEKLVLDWSETPHQPSISEFSRLRLREHRGVVLVTADRSAVVTLVPTAEKGHELVEMAAPEGVDLGEVWQDARPSIVQMARARGARALSVLTVVAAVADQLGREGMRPERTIVGGSLTSAELTSGTSGTLVRSFRRGVDEHELLRLVRLTMAEDLEIGGWDHADLEVRFTEPWFEPRGLLLARENVDSIGFCWTKVHPDGVGEIYLVGVEPSRTGRGVGRKLVQHGVRHLMRGRGCHETIAYWDGANRSATNLFLSMGFTIARTDEVYRLDL